MSIAEMSAGTQVSSHLDTDTVVGFLGVTNNELKCLALARLPVGECVSEADLYSALLVEMEGMPSQCDMRQSEFGAIIGRMPCAAVVTAKEGGGRFFRKTEAGELATALGGHMLDLSRSSSKSTRVLLGEHSPSSRKSNEEESMDSLEARLIVLHGLFTCAQNRWQKHKDLYETLATNGLDQRVAATHLAKLRAAGLVERRHRPNPRGGLIYESRLVPSDSFIKPPELIGNLLTTIARFAALDSKFIQEGLRLAVEISHDEKWVPGLVRRYVHNSGHYGKSATRSTKPR